MGDDVVDGRLESVELGSQSCIDASGAEGVRDAFDEQVRAESPQVVGHAARGHEAGVEPQQRSQMLPEIAVG